VENSGVRVSNPATPRVANVAIIGAGWAGAAAALTLARAGTCVTVFEATKVAGGRARRVEKGDRIFDNGQHLLLGAYSRSIGLIQSLYGANTSCVIERKTMSLRTAPSTLSPLTLNTHSLPAPLHLLAGLIGAKGFTASEKLSTCLWSARYLLREYPPINMTVASLIAEQPICVRELMWEPLCVAALNTPAERASARVFVEVLRRSFLGDRSASDMVIPRVDLSALLPDPALAEVVRLGGDVQYGTAVIDVTINPETSKGIVRARDSTQEFDYVIIATGPQHVSRLLAHIPEAKPIADTLSEFAYEPISTLHFEFAAGLDAESAAMLMLDGAPGQWLFAHRLPNGHVRASVVISAHHREEPEAQIMREGLAQLRRSYALPQPVWQQLVTEKRATYSCTPAQNQLLHTLPQSVGCIHFAGDWCVPDLPATLESAVTAGENAANAILKSITTITRACPEQ
jgi:hydroxysqualene dehydroxylase